MDGIFSASSGPVGILWDSFEIYQDQNDSEQ